IEEQWYLLEHAILSGQPSEGVKATLDHMLEEKGELDKELAESENREAQLQKEADEIVSDVTALKAKIEEMEDEKSKLEQRLDGMVLVKLGPIDLGKIPKIEQVVLPEYEKSNFEVPLSRVDRCTSCHAAVAKAGFDDLPNPLKTHPHKDLMD